MNSHANKTNNKTSSGGKREKKSAANKQSGNGSTFQLKDNRPETVAQRKLQKMADSSPQTEHTAQLQAKTSDSSPNNQQTIQKKDNKTGLPDNLKSGVENLSGYSMDDVKVHRNSDKPAQLNAHAYAKGTDIHLAPGQEKHLPHEAWHVVQQKQGRVKPTKQLKDKVNINDDLGLEKEADVMGERAAVLQDKSTKGISTEWTPSSTVQRMKKEVNFDQEVLSKEKSVDPLSTEYSEKLDKYAADNEAKGMDEKISDGGEITWAATFNRWIGNESTYSKFLKKVEEFNKSKDILQRQVLLMELKTLAQSWLDNHQKKILESGEKADKNELKKLGVIGKFIDQTTTNYKEVIASFEKFSIDLNEYLSDSSKFDKNLPAILSKYDNIMGKIDYYKGKYPPSINALFVAELEEFDAWIIKISAQTQRDVPRINLGTGVYGSGASIILNLEKSILRISGQIDFSVCGINEEAAGLFTRTISNGQDIITVQGGKWTKEVLGQKINLTAPLKQGDYLGWEFSNASGFSTFFNANVNWNAKGARIVSPGEFQFDSIEGVTSDSIETGFGIKGKEVKIKSSKDNKTLLVQGKTQLVDSTINELEPSKLFFETSNGVERKNFELQGGRWSTLVFGQPMELALPELAESKLKFNKCTGSSVIFEAKVAWTINDAGLNKAGMFEFNEFIGVADGQLNTQKGVMVDSVTFNANKGDNLKANGKLGAKLIKVIDVTKGMVDLELDAKVENITQIQINGAEGSADVLGTKFHFKEMSYDLKEQKVAAEEIEGSVKLLDKYDVNLIGKDVTIDENNDLDYKILEGTAKGDIDVGAEITISNPKVLLYGGNGKGGSSKTHYKGQMSWKYGEQIHVEGIALVDMDSEGKLAGLKIKNGKGDIKYHGIDLYLNNLSYNHKLKRFKAQTITSNFEILNQAVNIEITNGEVSEEAGFTFKAMTATMSDLELGLVLIKSTSVSYAKESGLFDGSFVYEINDNYLPNVIKDAGGTKGKLKFKWDPEKAENRSYCIEDANLHFKLIGQTLETENTYYDSKEQKLGSEKATLKLDIGFLKDTTLIGEGIEISKKTGFDFKKISTSAGDKEFDFGVVNIKPEEYAIVNDKKGLGVKGTGEGSLDLPEIFNANAGASFKGYITAYLGNLATPEVKMTEGQAQIEVANPIVELAKFLGDGWGKTRFELGASIPVFPGIAAIFGVYIQLLAQMPDKIKGTAELKNEILTLALELKSKLEVEGGVFGGVQAGNQLLIALAVLLRAAAKMGIDLNVGYSKKFNTKKDSQKPDKELKSNDEGFTYALTGELKAGAYLDLVATAFYFFQKTFTLELAEWTLGEFEFSDKKKELPKGGEGSKFSEDKLREKVTPEALKDAEVAKMKADQLLDQKQNERFSVKQKAEILATIKSAEEGRGTMYIKAYQDKEAKKESGELETGGESIFNNVAAMNMQFMDKYVDNFVTWDKVHDYLSRLDEAKKLLNLDERKKVIKQNLMLLKDVLTIPGDFKVHYADLKKNFVDSYDTYKGAKIESYKKYLANKETALEHVHSFKTGIHSHFFGDETLIDAKMRDWSIIGKSPLEELVDSYTSLYTEIDKVKDEILISSKDARYEKAEVALTEMNMEHQKRLEKVRSKSTKPLPASSSTNTPK